GSLVGTYEESILTGRMSTLPSLPLWFIAQIGVLGLGPNCPAKLRCPPHITLDFPAYFYAHHEESFPSPYVGTLDLNQAINSTEKKKRKINLSSPLQTDYPIRSSSPLLQSPSSPPVPEPLGYRIPAQGRLQVIIKNAQKTAIRLFLIPYNLQDMPIGYKTFLRQVIYREASGSSMPIDGKSSRAISSAIHIHVRRSSRTRWYVYGPVRVVFGHRVLEQGIGDKEIVEIKGPENPKWVP
ncbi:MAG: hypothetical protein DHS80DRAFT_3157, partial [Piptocephalis tieghemiana]